MPKTKKPNPDRHYYEIPSDISEFTDAQIDAWAKQLYGQIVSEMKPTINEPEKRDGA